MRLTRCTIADYVLRFPMLALPALGLAKDWQAEGEEDRWWMHDHPNRIHSSFLGQHNAYTGLPSTTTGMPSQYWVLWRVSFSCSMRRGFRTSRNKFLHHVKLRKHVG